MKTTIQGGCRVYNHRHFPNILHAKFVQLKKDTGKTIEFLIVAHLELALEMGSVSLKVLDNGAKPSKETLPISNDSTWELVKVTNTKIPNRLFTLHSKIISTKIPVISEDLCMPHDVVAIEEEIV